MNKGDFVHYAPFEGMKKNGRIKSIEKNCAFVVYNAEGDWENFEQYTAALTPLPQLRPGWVNQRGELIDIPLKSMLTKSSS